MDWFALGCASLEIDNLKPFMDAVGLLGRGVTAPAIGTALFAYGRFRRNAKVKNVGAAIVISLIVTAVVVNLLKILLQLPRPTPRSGFGFPSGDSGTAFSFAAALAFGYPVLAPALYFLAALVSAARLYFRAHFVWDVLGGAAIGIASARYVARRFLDTPPRRRFSWSRCAAWLPAALLAGAAALFFLSLEAKIAGHKRAEPPAGEASMEIDFGTPAAQTHLLAGWSPDKTWREPRLTMNWVEGRHAALKIPIRPDQNYRLRFHAYPYRPTGFVCQRNTVSVNGRTVGTVYLEQDWNFYELRLPRDLLREKENKIHFAFSHASNLDWHGINGQRKPLSVAFDRLELVAERPR
jgi:membrane-associated phospholipid phosphatase